MATSYQYAKKDGSMGTFEAESDELAGRLASSQPDALPTTGAQRVDAASTIESSPVRRYNPTPNESVKGSTGSEIDSYYQGLKDTKVDERKIRDQARKAVQGQIDVINTTYERILADDRLEGLNNLGRTRATAARSGLLGSDFGNEQLNETERYNNKVIAAREEERAAKISQILGQADQKAQERIDNAVKEAKADREKYIGFLKEKMTDARTELETLGKQGITVDDLTDDQYKKLLETTGYSPEQFKAALTLARPKDDVLYSEVVGSKYIQVARDPITGKISSTNFDLGFTVPQGYSSTNLGGGRVIFTPDNWDGDPSKIIAYTAAPAPGSSESGYKVPTQARNNLYKYGFQPGEVDALEGDIRLYGLGKALEGLDAESRDLIQRELDKDFVY